MLLRAVALFSERHPDCVVHVHEAPLATTRSSLRDGTIDVLIASYPFDGMANGPALLHERRVLAVPAYHPLAYVPIRDAPPIRRGPVWLASNTTARVREFVRAAVDANPAPVD